MNVSVEQISTLERINYQANQSIARITPGVELHLRDDVIITSSEIFPSPDANHACLLQATTHTADDLIREIISYFQAKDLPPTLFISPACTPPDLTKRLKKHGFVKTGEKEAWMILDNLSEYKTPALSPKVIVKQITRAEVLTFANTFMTAFEMPLEFAPSMAQLIEPSTGLSGVYHYLAFIDEQPVGTFSLICYNKFGIIGSAGVVPDHRGKKAVTNLAIEGVKTAQRSGLNTLILQTTAGILLERLLGLYGFNKVFTRIGYTLS